MSNVKNIIDVYKNTNKKYKIESILLLMWMISLGVVTYYTT